MDTNHRMSAEEAANANDDDIAAAMLAGLSRVSSDPSSPLRSAASSLSSLMHRSVAPEPDDADDADEAEAIDLGPETASDEGNETPDETDDTPATPARRRGGTSSIFDADSDREPVDPTTIDDPGVRESVTERDSGIDYDALMGRGRDDDEMDDPTIDGYARDIDDNIAMFAPARPAMPEMAADAGNDFDTNETGDSTGDDTHSASADDTDDPFADMDIADYDDGDYAVSERAARDGEDADEKSTPRWRESWSRLPLWAKSMALALPVIVVAGVMLLSPSGGNAPAPSNGGGVVAENPSQAPAPAPPSGAAPSDAEPQVLTEYIKTVSAKCAEGGTSPTQAFSSNENSAWVCPRSLGIDGSVLNIVFTQPVQITEIRFTPGYNLVRQPAGDDEWVRHRVVSQVVWRAGGKNFVQVVEPTRGESIFEFDQPVATDAMSMTIQQSITPDKVKGDALPGQEVAGSSEVNDATAVQNIQIIGKVL